MIQKNELHDNYKIYRNLISTLMRRSKPNITVSIYFESNLTNIKYLKMHQSIIAMRRYQLLQQNLLFKMKL